MSEKTSLLSLFAIDLLDNLPPLLQQFPYPPFYQDRFFAIVSVILVLLVMVAFIFSAGYFVKVLYYVLHYTILV